MRARILIALVLCVPLMAQTTPGVAAGLVYQAALESGISYIEPSAGQAIINQRVALNWNTIAGQVFSDGSIGVLMAGLAGVIHLSVPVEIGLASFHAFYDHTVAPLIAEGVPTPSSIAPVLPMNGTMTPTATACAEASMYALWAKGAHVVGPVMVGGLIVTYAPQGVAVLRNISGARIKSVQVVDVVACLPAN